MTSKLTLHTVGTFRKGPVFDSGTPHQYEVLGMPSGHRAWIAEFKPHWKILREDDGIQDHWTGEYASAEAALLQLQGEQVES